MVSNERSWSLYLRFAQKDKQLSTVGVASSEEKWNTGFFVNFLQIVFHMDFKQFGRGSVCCAWNQAAIVQYANYPYQLVFFWYFPALWLYAGWRLLYTEGNCEDIPELWRLKAWRLIQVHSSLTWWEPQGPGSDLTTPPNIPCLPGED